MFLNRNVDAYDLHVNRLVNLLVVIGLACCVMLLATSCQSTNAGGSSEVALEPYFEHEHDGRIYVIGTIDREVKFADSPHLPYSQTHIAGGPKGETVVVEVDKKDPELAKRLWEEYKDRNLFYAELPHNGRIYLLGSDDSLRDFKAQHHMPYTRTMIGYGPAGETVVIEVDKKNPWLARRLQIEFENRHRFYEEVTHDGRVYVIGDAETHDSFMAQHHLPYTHTRIGAGPGGATLVFEVDKKNPALLVRIKGQYEERHGVELD